MLHTEGREAFLQESGLCLQMCGCVYYVNVLGVNPLFFGFDISYLSVLIYGLELNSLLNASQACFIYSIAWSQPL